MVVPIVCVLIVMLISGEGGRAKAKQYRPAMSSWSSGTPTGAASTSGLPTST
jgi:hypothetical protein